MSRLVTGLKDVLYTRINKRTFSNLATYKLRLLSPLLTRKRVRLGGATAALAVRTAGHIKQQLGAFAIFVFRSFRYHMMKKSSIGIS